MANKKLNATITIGGAIASSLTGAFGTVKKGVDQIGSAIQNLERRQRTLANSIQTFGRMGKDVDGLRAKYDAVSKAIDKAKAAQDRLNRATAARQANLDKRAEYQGRLGGAVAMAASLGAPIAQAVQFENAMLGVAKQVDGARDSSGKLTKVYFDMGRQIQQLGREIPLATNDLADMVTAGARMGVARDELIEFTRTAAKMADAFELPAGELADSMGKIAGLYKIPIPAIGELADAINYLDDNAISKGGDIIDFLQRTGGVAATVKITGKEMAALGSTLLTMGERTETAGTAVNAMMSKFGAAEKGTKKFRAAMDDIGLSTEAVQKGMQKDAVGTLQKIVTAINKMPKDQRLGIMVDLVGLEHSDTLAKLANGMGEFRRQLELANGEAAKGSMDREFQARLATTTAQWKITKNVLTELSVTFGQVLLPAINDVLKSVIPLASNLADFTKEHPQLTKVIVGTTAALVGLRIATFAAGYAFTFLKGGVLNLGVALAGTRAKMAINAASTAAMGAASKAASGGLMGMATRALPLVAGAVRALGVALMTTPIGWIIGGIATAGLLIYRYWDGLKAFMVGTWQGFGDAIKPVTDRFGTLLDMLKPLRPLFDMVAGGVKIAWDWFTKLFEPVSFTSAELKKAGDAGQEFGKALAGGIELVTRPLQWLIDSLKWLDNNIGAVLDKAVNFKNTVANNAGQAWGDTKKMFGSWDGFKQAVGLEAPQPQKAPPAAPQMATGRSAGASYTDNSKNDIHITQRAGESNADLAKRTADELERRRRVRQNSMMQDGATAQ